MRTFLIAVAVFGMFFMPRTTRGETVQTPDILISEIAWSGSSLSDADEWLELANLTDTPVDLTGWYVEGAAGTNSIVLNSGSIPAHGTFLIANYDRGNSKSVLDVSPNLVTSSVSLSNTNLQLTLKDPAGEVRDSVDSASAGTSGAIRASMERTALTTWKTATESTGLHATGTDFGTPGTHAISTSSISAGAHDLNAPSSTLVPLPVPTSPQIINPPIDPPGYAEHDIIITEFSTRDDEWVEYRNETDDTITLEGFVIEDESGRRTTLSGNLTPHSYGVARAASGTLNNDRDVLRLRDRSGRILDAVQYGKTSGLAPAPGEGQVAARSKVSTNSNVDFVISSFATPGSVNVIIKPKSVSHETLTAKTGMPVPKPEKPTLALTSAELSAVPILTPLPRIRIAGPSSFYAQQPGVFTATLTRAGSGYEFIEWFLDDAYLGRGQSVSVIADSGSYTLRAELEHDDGRISESSRHIRVRELPAPKASAVPTSAKRSTGGGRLGSTMVLTGTVIAQESIVGARKVLLADGTTLALTSGKLPVLAPGHSIRAHGTRSRNGKTFTVKTASAITVTGTTDLAPHILEPDEIDESRMNTFVSASGVVSRIKGKTFTLSGDTHLNVYWKAGESLPAGLVQEGAELRVSGVLSLRSNQWTILPRNAEDVTVLKAAPPQIEHADRATMGSLGTWMTLSLAGLFAVLGLKHLIQHYLMKRKRAALLAYEVDSP